MAPRTARARCVDRMAFVTSTAGTADWAVGAAVDATHVSPVGRLNDGDEFDVYRKHDNNTWSWNPGTYRAGSTPSIQLSTPHESSAGGAKTDFPGVPNTVIAAPGFKNLVQCSSHGLLTNMGVLQGLADLDVFINPDSYAVAGEGWMPYVTAPGSPAVLPSWSFVRTTVLSRLIMADATRKALMPHIFGTGARPVRRYTTRTAAEADDWAAEFNDGDCVELWGKSAEGDEEVLRYIYNAASTTAAAWPDVLQCSPGGTPQATGRMLLKGPTLKTSIGDAPYTILLTDRFVITSATLTAPRTWTLPAASTLLPGTKIQVSDLFGAINGSNSLTVAANGSDTINGQASIAFGAAYGGAIFQTDGVSKWTLAGSGSLAALIRGQTIGASAFQTALAAAIAGAKWRISARQDDDPQTDFSGEVDGDASAPVLRILSESGNLEASLSGTNFRLQNTGLSPKNFSYAIERLI